MAIWEVVKYGHPVLRRKVKNCRPEEIAPQFIDDMIETMRALDGAGLAATQVNVERQLLVAVEPERGVVHVLLNPQIIAFSEKKSIDTEGCLSLPRLQAQVMRHEKIIVRAQNPQGQTIELDAKGLFARILQHEIDHLNGVLYVDRADLKTLVWLTKVKDKEEPEKVPTTLEEVKKEFRHHYHADAKNLEFDSERG
jgi:peptide deformylase